MKKTIRSVVAVLFVLVMMAASVIPASAASPYQTYTYSIDGTALYSPDAYTPSMIVDSTYMGLETPIDDPRDLVVDDQKNVYIADAKNNRIVVLDRYYKLKFIIDTFTNDIGVPDELTAPSGLFVTKNRIFVCDTDANRIVTFDRDGNFLARIKQPESSLFEEDAVYKPVAIAVDKYDRLFVVSSTTYQGVIVMTDEGEFTGFIGAQSVSLSAWEILWRRLQTSDQRALSGDNVSTEFNNITVTEEGFVYATTSTIKDKDVQNFIKKKSSDGKYSPVKLLNAKGDEIMKRNGFWPPAGEVDNSRYSSLSTAVGPSKVIDVAVGPEKTWSIIDEKRNKVFTYDYNGNLLFAFGDDGAQMGNLASIEAVVYQGEKLLLLDKTNDNFTVYDRTEYGEILVTALAHQNNQQYDRAVEDWTEILKRNSNFDAAYIGIGNALYRSGDYNNALNYFRAAYDTTNFSKAYKEIRTEWISNYIIVIPIVLVAVIVGWTFLNKYAKKINTKAATAGGKRTFKEELLYIFHVVFHPFDGFWDLKHEKRGSVRASLVFLTITILAFYYQAIGQGYITNPQGRYSGLFSQITGVLVPLLLFAISNWCLTTLFDGEGSFKDIFIACSYSLLPLPLFIIPVTMYSNVALKNETDILDLFITIGFIWLGFLLFFGVMVTHDYSLGKNVLTVLGTLVAMICIMFIAILFTSLLGKMVGLVTNIVTEISYRM